MLKIYAFKDSSGKHGIEMLCAVTAKLGETAINGKGESVTIVGLFSDIEYRDQLTPKQRKVIDRNFQESIDFKHGIKPAHSEPASAIGKFFLLISGDQVLFSDSESKQNCENVGWVYGKLATDSIS